MVTVINNMTRTNTNIVTSGALEYLLESLNLSSSSRQKTSEDQYSAAHRTVSKAVIGKRGADENNLIEGGHQLKLLKLIANYSLR